MLVTLSGMLTLVRLLQSSECVIPDAGDAVGDGDARQASCSYRMRDSSMLVTLRPSRLVWDLQVAPVALVG